MGGTRKCGVHHQFCCVCVLCVCVRACVRVCVCVCVCVCRSRLCQFFTAMSQLLQGLDDGQSGDIITSMIEIAEVSSSLESCRPGGENALSVLTELNTTQTEHTARNNKAHSLPADFACCLMTA